MRLVIGIGNEHRRDDGVGPAVARRLGQTPLPHGVRVEALAEATALLDLWRDAGQVFVIDAVRAGGRPGAIHRWDAAARPLPVHLSPLSSHGFGLAETLELARALRRLPPRLIIYAIEGADFGHGPGLTPALERAADRLLRRLMAEIST
ncbi:MAG: hydrogenase maturation protease [Pseudomonadota bacterium]|nr:hydrogenase maturation protease [Pseudomonadota bacterium]